MTTDYNRAGAALEAYPFSDQRPIDIMTDFLPDLMQWCVVHGLDFDALVISAMASVETPSR